MNFNLFRFSNKRGNLCPLVLKIVMFTAKIDVNIE